MKNWDPNSSTPEEWRQALEQWKADQKAARDAQAAARRQLDRAEARLATLTAWQRALNDAILVTRTRAEQLDRHATELGSTDRSIAAVSDAIADHDEARAIASARVLAGPATATAIVLLPLRVQTQWQGSTLAVRYYPDDISIDSHDPRLTPDERSAGEAYWSMQAAGAEPETRQAWDNLVRRTSATRGAWIVRATDPSVADPAAPTRASEWETTVTPRLLPDRFAVVAFAAGEPIDVASASEPPRFVTWACRLPQQLEIDGLHEPDAATWMTDLDAALAVGMAVRIDVPASAPRIEQLLVIGLHGDTETAADELGGMLEAHAFTAGLEVLADGTSTNNSDEIRAAHSPLNDSEVARGVVDPLRPTDLADGSAGAQLADVLGIARARVAAVSGAAADRQTVADAARLLVGVAATGALVERVGPGAAPWPLVAPAGCAPVLRVGRQPYGILPATAPLHWHSTGAERSAALASLLRGWGRARGAAVDLDPGDPPVAPPAARHITRDDNSALPDLLLEAPSSTTWSTDGTPATQYTGLDGLVGPVDGPQSAAEYLTALAAASDGDLDAIAATLPPALLARLALAARRRVPAADRASLVAGLRSLADRARSDGGRAELARVITGHLDALSHRIDAWLTAASAERLRAQRAAAPPGILAVGAYGYLTDVEPRTQPRSHGHVHAPSLAHAATAAVLRAGYLGQRRAAWVTRVARARDELAAAPASAAARRALTEAETGLARLLPLDAQSESALPLALDVSSRRVRQARSVLGAVRTGQPLAAVLGYQFERDLADAGLQHYLAAFRKLTRFSTGTQLEALEEARRRAKAALAAAIEQLAGLRAAAAATVPAVDAATDARTAAQLAEQRAVAAAAPYQAMQRELALLDTNVIPRLTAELAKIDSERPAPRDHTREITVP